MEELFSKNNFVALSKQFKVKLEFFGDRFN